MKYQWFLVHQVLSRPVQREWYWTTKFRLLHMQQIRDHRLFRRLLRIVSDKRPIYHRGYWLGVGSRCRIYSITGLALTMTPMHSRATTSCRVTLMDFRLNSSGAERDRDISRDGQPHRTHARTYVCCVCKKRCVSVQDKINVSFT